MKDQQTFEAAIKRLEEIVRQLEQGEIPVEECLALFEEGVNLSRFCRTKLDEAEQRISILLKDEAGIFHREPFSPAANGKTSETDS